MNEFEMSYMDKCRYFWCEEPTSCKNRLIATLIILFCIIGGIVMMPVVGVIAPIINTCTRDSQFMMNGSCFASGIVDFWIICCIALTILIFYGVHNDIISYKVDENNV